MLAQLSFGILTLTFLLSLYSIGAAIFGHFVKSERWLESARRAMLLTFPLLTLVVVALVYLLIRGHFEVAYVYTVTDVNMPFYLKITALWGGQAGSLLFWSWLLSAAATATAWQRREPQDEFLPWMIAVISATLAFFLFLNIFFENPFTRWWLTPAGTFVQRMFAPPGATLITPSNGNGLNEILRHPGMIFHPPMLYLGFTLFVVPYAIAVSALASGHIDGRWLQSARRWALTAWLFLSIGLVLGMWWAYDVLGWGGYWGWDPVEVAALAPWLVGTAFLHSISVQEKRGILKRWSLVFIVLTYEAVIYGAFLVRSGLVSSVHAFAQSDLGPAFLGFVALTSVVSLGLLLHRWKDLEGEGEIASFFSREALFLYNNLFFLFAFLVCEIGIHYPLLYELATNSRATVGPPWYEATLGPLLAALLLLMGLAPLSAWGYSAFKTLGRTAWKPMLPALLVPLALFLSGVHNGVALLGFTLIALSISVTLYEYGRSVWIRKTARGENIFYALRGLTAQNRRRYGGYIVHLAMAVMAIGIIGIEIFQATTQKNLALNEEIRLAGYRLRFDSLEQTPSADGRIVTRAALSLWREDQALGQLYPRSDLYPSGQLVAIPAIHSTLGGDLYVVLINWEELSESQAPFKVYYNPLINWLWIGSGLLIIGYLVAAWPSRSRGKEYAGRERS